MSFPDKQAQLDPAGPGGPHAMTSPPSSEGGHLSNSSETALGLKGAQSGLGSGAPPSMGQMRSDSHAMPHREVACISPGKQALLTWKDVSVTVFPRRGESKEILNQVSGYAEPGQLLALMGPSGCGKSTLLDTLAGRLPKSAQQSGEILLNGVSQSLAYGVAAYVRQDDFLIGALTVQETLQCAASLRLPEEMSRKEKQEVVARILLEMGLQESADQFIGNWHMRGISGGKKRRVSIAIELITEPALLFLDEPTSGLDSASAYFVMAMVKRLCNAGRTVVSAIHQPSGDVFNMFDMLCLLTEGYVVYFGPRSEATEIFRTAGLPCPPLRNPPDHFLRAVNHDFNFVRRSAVLAHVELGPREPMDELESSEVVDRLLAAYRSSPIMEKAQARSEELSRAGGNMLLPLRPVGLFTQTLVLTQRCFLNMLRNIGIFWLRLGMYLVLMLCIGTAFFNIGYSYTSISARAAVLFYIVSFLTFMAVAGFPAFVEDMRVFERERSNGYYSVGAFVISDTLSSLPFVFLIAVVSTVVGYFLINLQLTVDSVFCFLLLLFASLAVSEALMMAIAVMVPNFLMGIAAGAGLMGIFMLVCGFLRLPFDLPAPVWRYPMHYIAFQTYAFQGFMQNEFTGLTFDGPTESGLPQISGAEALAFFDIPMDLGPNVTKWVDLVILFGWMFFYRILFFALIKFKEFLKAR